MKLHCRSTGFIYFQGVCCLLYKQCHIFILLGLLKEVLAFFCACLTMSAPGTCFRNSVIFLLREGVNSGWELLFQIMNVKEKIINIFFSVLLVLFIYPPITRIYTLVERNRLSSFKKYGLCDQKKKMFQNCVLFCWFCSTTHQ